MDEIVKPITDAESRAKKIKQQASDEALKIAERAETEAADIARKNESDCKLFKETEINRAEKEGNENYNAALEKKRAETSAYADGVLKKSDSVVLEIVRRVLSGDC